MYLYFDTDDLAPTKVCLENLRMATPAQSHVVCAEAAVCRMGHFLRHTGSRAGVLHGNDMICLNINTVDTIQVKQQLCCCMA